MNADTPHAAPPDNVVQLADQIFPNGEKTKAAGELELKRKAALKAFQISARQLESDALRFEERAIVGEVPLAQRHQLMDHARGLRIACEWLKALQSEPEAKDTLKRELQPGEARDGAV